MGRSGSRLRCEVHGGVGSGLTGLMYGFRGRKADCPLDMGECIRSLLINSDTGSDDCPNPEKSHGRWLQNLRELGLSGRPPSSAVKAAMPREPGFNAQSNNLHREQCELPANVLPSRSTSLFGEAPRSTTLTPGPGPDSAAMFQLARSLSGCPLCRSQPTSRIRTTSRTLHPAAATFSSIEPNFPAVDGVCRRNCLHKNSLVHTKIAGNPI